jgi:hypothetical protein
MLENLLMKVIDRLILEDSIRSWADVSEADRAELTIIKMNEYGAAGWECVLEVGDINNLLVKYMINPEPCRALDIAAALEKLFIEYHDNHLSMLFAAQLHIHKQEWQAEHGKESFIDTTNGEQLCR